MKRAIAALALTAGALGLTGGAAGAAPGPDHKSFPVQCQTGTLRGETLTVVSQKWVYRGDDLLRVTAFHFEFGDKVKDQQFGKTEGNLTCGGTETSPEGTFTFLATLVEV